MMTDDAKEISFKERLEIADQLKAIGFLQTKEQYLKFLNEGYLK
jgi:hypothetical protein